MTIKKWLALVVLIVSAGCATNPKKISASYVFPIQYRSYDCDQVAMESAHVERRTSDPYHSLKRDADNDAWQMGVGLVLFWPTLFALEGGDGVEASEYARLKGQYEALRTVSVQRKCDLEFRDELADVVEEGASDENKRARPNTKMRK